MISDDLSQKAAEIAAWAQGLRGTRGYNGFSYADISKAMRIINASIHDHFLGKVELVQTLQQLLAPKHQS